MEKTDFAATVTQLPLGLVICIPDNLVSSDTYLSTIDFSSSPHSDYGFLCSMKVQLHELFWFSQKKVKQDDLSGRSESISIDKFLLKVTFGKDIDSPCYVMCDVFFDIDNNTYILKALGTYSSIPKVLSANFRHHGTLEAERFFSPPVGVGTYKLPAATKFNKRAQPLFFWLENRAILLA